MSSDRPLLPAFACGIFVLAAILLLSLAGCSVAGTPSVGAQAISDTTTSVSTTASAGRPSRSSTASTTTTQVTSSASATTTPSLQSAPADFTAYSDLTFAARWNDFTNDPEYEGVCEALIEDGSTACWSVQVWNGSVACPTGVTVEVDLHDGTAATAGAKVGSDFGISLAENIQPYSSTLVHIFTDKTSPSGELSAAITGIRCSL